MTRLITVAITVAAILSGCVMLRNEEWINLQQDIRDLKKTTEALKLEAQEIQKSAGTELSARMASVEKALSDAEKDLRKRQADMSATIITIRSDFQVLIGRFEELRYASQKAISEGKAGKEEAELKYKEIAQRLEDLQKRVTSMEQSLVILRQVKEQGKEQIKEKVADAPDVDAAYKDAHETYQKRDYKTAREKFQKYLDAYPNSKYSENARYWIAESYYNEKDYERAIVEFDEMVKKFPDGVKAPPALLKQGMAFSAIGDKKSANAIFKQLVEKYPKSEQARAAKKKLK